MPLSDAKRKANEKYKATHTTMQGVSWPIADYDELKDYCASHGLSRNGFIRAAVADAIARGFIPDKAQGKR